ncbi:MAG TPA: MlaD family protein [Bacteroidales bacterium]|nr:MlaD family protein [Bacteroidales bacterium]
MNESSHKHSVVVGLFVLLGLAILVGGVLLIGNLNRSLQSRIKLISCFDDVNGLQKGNYVWFSGVRIGTVKSLRLRSATGVEVVMDIDAKVRQFIYKDSRVKLGSDGFIGNRILIIFGGTPVASMVQEGDTLRFEKTLSTDDLVGTLQANNENLKAITSDFKIISRKMAEGEGTLGKLLNDDSFYNNMNSVATSLNAASSRAQELISALADFSSGLKKNGTLAHELTSDTAVFRSLKASVLKLRMITDTASDVINHLKAAENNPKTPVGVLTRDEKAGTDLRETISNLQKSTIKLNEDLEGLQHSFPLKHYFKKKEKAVK